MKNNLLYTLVLLLLLGTIASCKSNKIECPTYADSQPAKHKKKGKPGSQKPVVEKISKPRSGVLPPGYGKKK
jgi:hypothetical protein